LIPKSRLDFVSRALSGATSHEEIDDYIEQLNVNPGGLALHEHLALGRVEYAIWLPALEQLGTFLARRKVTVST
jgi:hypothetical protein